jgi:hypothetical protein
MFFYGDRESAVLVASLPEHHRAFGEHRQPLAIKRMLLQNADVSDRESAVLVASLPEQHRAFGNAADSHWLFKRMLLQNADVKF